MTENEFTEELHKKGTVIDKKIQYGENEYSCFACGEKIKLDTKICPYCKIAQDKNETILK